MIKKIHEIRNKKSSLRIIAMCIFSVAFTIPQVTSQEEDFCFLPHMEHKFDKVKIINRLKYNVKVQIRRDNIDSNSEGSSKLDLLGNKNQETLDFIQVEADLSSPIKINVYPIERNLTFDCISTNNYLNSRAPTLLHCTIIKGLDVLGDFTVVALLDDTKTLNIQIDSDNFALKRHEHDNLIN